MLAKKFQAMLNHKWPQLVSAFSQNKTRSLTLEKGWLWFLHAPLNDFRGSIYAIAYYYFSYSIFYMKWQRLKYFVHIFHAFTVRDDVLSCRFLLFADAQTISYQFAKLTDGALEMRDIETKDKTET